MNYLAPADYERYGLENTVPDGWITTASAMIDAHCRRPTLGVTQYTERVRVSPGARSVRLTYVPLAIVAPAVNPISAARGRFAQLRRGEAVELMADIAQAFALPGAWTSIDATMLDAFPATGEVNAPSTILGFTFDELELTYTAGLEPIPEPVMQACALIVRNALSTPALNLKSSQIDTMKVEYFRDSLLDESVRKMLAPWVAQKVG